MASEKPADKLWQGRFTESMDSVVEAFTASVQFDQRLARYDIEGSIAHATMLEAVGVLTREECAAIVRGLENIRADIDAGNFSWSQALEDVHMNVEATLTEGVLRAESVHLASAAGALEASFDLRLPLGDADLALRLLDRRLEGAQTRALLDQR